MAAPVLLVADDLSTIAAVKRVLAREGYEVILATSAADAVIAWGHSLPGLLLLQPSVEGDRGAIVLEELQAHPDSGLLRVLLLGETLPGFGYQVEPLPIDQAHFAETLAETMRASVGTEQWELTEAPKRTEPPAPSALERDDWRATAPTDPSQGGAPPSMPGRPELEDRLFGDLPSLEEAVHADIEAEAIASVESSLAARDHQDEELRQLEVEVRAEAQRRRETKETKAPQAASPAQVDDDETSFATEPTPPPVASTTSRVTPPPGCCCTDS